MRRHKRYRIVFQYIIIVAALLVLAVIGVLGYRIYKNYQSDKGLKAEQVSEEQAKSEEKKISKSDREEKKEVDISEQNEGQNIDMESQEGVEEEASAEQQTKVEIEDPEKEVENILAAMTLEEKIAQMFFITPEALTGAGSVTAAGETTRMSVNQYPVGGIIYFKNNIVSEEQFSSMVQNIQSYSMERIGLPLFVGLDEEGGTVNRITGRGMPNVPDIADMFSVGATGDPQKAYQIGCQIGEYLERFQVNVDFAPVADVYSNPNNAVIGTRSFGTDANLVASMVEQEVLGLKEYHIAATLKHFPGHGDTAQDSHSGMALSYKTLEEIHSCELIPFQKGIDAGAEFVMMGHISYPNILNSDIPSSLSYTMVSEILRQEMGFEGIIITDGMNMGAIANRYNSASAAVQAVQAGVDMILMPNDFRAAYEGLLGAVREGTIEESRIDQSVQRILKEKISI